MRTPTELMTFVMVAGAVLLMVLWTLWRWRTGARDRDPAARVLAGIALATLGGMLGAGPWSWIPGRYGAWTWGAFAAAAGLFVADWVRERAARRRR